MDPCSQILCTALHKEEVLGYVAIDSTIAGHASGGLRLATDVTASELRDLARTMTLKYGFLGLPQGGAKGLVFGDPEEPEPYRSERLERFARAIAPLMLSRIYLPGEDMGTRTADIRMMLEAASIPIHRRELRCERSGYYTALSVFTAARAAARHLQRELSGLTVAIQGFGKVAAPLALMLADAGAVVVAASTIHGALYNPRGLDVRRLAHLAENRGAQLVDHYPDAEIITNDRLLELDVDLLCPCACLNCITEDNAPRLQARLIVDGANNPISRDAERILAERGTLCLPDFVTTCGGVLGGRMELAAFGPETIVPFIEQHIGRRIGSMLEDSARQGATPRQVAESLSGERFKQMQHRQARPSPVSRLFRIGLAAQRRGWLPTALVRHFALGYFTRMVQ